jgi:hypothetical protein
MKNNQGIERSEADVKYWHIWDEDDWVDLGGTREPRDGDRFAIILQPLSKKVN